MNRLRITLAAGVAAALACTAMSTTARADEEKGLSVGFRVGYAAALGKVDSQQSLGDLQRASTPFWFDLGYRFDRHWYLGAFYLYAPTYPGAHCLGAVPAGQTTCDGNDQRFGINLAYHILPKKIVDPWVGLGVGYEFMRLNYGLGAGSDSNAFLANGMQFFDVQLGADLRFIDRLPFGPFADFSFGQFGNESTTDANGNSTKLNFSSALHEWFTIGARIQFNL